MNLRPSPVKHDQMDRLSSTSSQAGASRRKVTTA